ncbi:SOS response-associated peptidase [Ureibacillus acetophenoni]|uniref:Abasic site processing protein n=1 Tax=Ureibacillus acetophenoni TaxID=614649 RepID=A0A285UKE2_9BACL|nr:SOS response-associated peptidase [Ureibacillus acetophenoni]SOC42365.1 putative SOS response-associated peptidase YedK [Ureibacillus acetophenoni]
MCGRFTLFASFEKILEEFDIQQAIEEVFYEASYNIAPSQQILSIINDGQKNRMGFLKWGLVPAWSKDEKMASKMINARSETVDEKPSFRKSFYQRRCLIPMDSFFEWKKDGNSKTPMRITMKDNSLFGVAGLWDTWKSPTGEAIYTCTILTTEPNDLMRGIHDRMPVILSKEQQLTWLDPRIHDKDQLKSLLVPFDAEKMIAYQVSELVNSPKNNSEELIARIS